MKRIVILDAFTAEQDYTCWDELKNIGELEIYHRTSPNEIVKRCAGAWAVLTNKVPLSAESIESLPCLKYIGVLATGYNIVDIAAARARGVTVTNIPGYSTDSVAQSVFALLLELTNHVGLHSEAVMSGEWQKCTDFTFRKGRIIELCGKTMGIIGFGQIGHRVSEIARAFGMNVITSSLKEKPEYVKYYPLEDLLRNSDVVSLNTALTPENHNMINKQTLSLMKPTAYLINTARGPLIDETALAEALRDGIIAGAGLDVLTQEPPRNGSPLFGLSNCVITPHIAWQSTDALGRLVRIAVNNLEAFEAGTPQNIVS